ncbi:hypothetical protein [Lysinibacillus pakistanensis]|uniref:DUF1797 family protein n=1 Tax=Lysinibacillus pakistanensis TaxID=759811 RepID=A0AAX3WWS3_9BACI|nr:hypothetical protein [Lysinibacillus pakistanensis]MDM5231501.1 hypothetical protein [Lysinibacillus pakistanensis]WHY47048.1 hypothetical protein QNH22_02170 [Lysinibacillus pakistanensis]WHY52059.1 hypothetical protein QNH24_02165 [Lysinibacillus pakistanensis]
MQNENLQELIYKLEVCLKTARTLQDEMLNQYFLRYEPKENKQDKAFVIFDFERMGIFASLVHQQITLTEKRVNKIKMEELV